MKCQIFAKFQVFGIFLKNERVVFSKVRKPLNLFRHYHLPENFISCSRIGEVGSGFAPLYEVERAVLAERDEAAQELDRVHLAAVLKDLNCGGRLSRLSLFARNSRWNSLMVASQARKRR
jgi:hypothetical protein